MRDIYASDLDWMVRTHRLTPDLEFVIHEPAYVYHAKAKSHLSSHALADFRRCPLLCRRKEQGLIAADRDSAAYLIGRAAHTLILEGRERYETEYAVGGPVNPHTGQPFGSNTQAFAEWAERIGKPVLDDAQAALVEHMAASVRGHLFARELLREGVAEGVVRVRYGDQDCQARIDWIDLGRGIVVLKTCDNLDDFERDFRAFEYAHQSAFYRELVAEAAGAELDVHLIAVEEREPFRCGVWQISRALLERAADMNLAAMDELKRCRETGMWPTRFESVRLIDSP